MKAVVYIDLEELNKLHCENKRLAGDLDYITDVLRERSAEVKKLKADVHVLHIKLHRIKSLLGE